MQISKAIRDAIYSKLYNKSKEDQQKQAKQIGEAALKKHASLVAKFKKADAQRKAAADKLQELLSKEFYCDFERGNIRLLRKDQTARADIEGKMLALDIALLDDGADLKQVVEKVLGIKL